MPNKDARIRINTNTDPDFNTSAKTNCSGQSDAEGRFVPIREDVFEDLCTNLMHVSAGLRMATNGGC